MTTYKSITICPYCDSRHDRVTPISEAFAQQPNDLTLCLSCGEICQFDSDLNLEKFSETEFEQLDKGTKAVLRRMQIYIQSSY